jgi:hypothetical protein
MDNSTEHADHVLFEQSSKLNPPMPPEGVKNERPALPFKDGWVSEAFECGSF